MLQVKNLLAVKTYDNEDSDDDEVNDDAEKEDGENDDVEDNDDDVKDHPQRRLRKAEASCLQRLPLPHLPIVEDIKFEFDIFITSCQHSVLYVVSHKPTDKSFNR